MKEQSKFNKLISIIVGGIVSAAVIASAAAVVKTERNEVKIDSINITLTKIEKSLNKINDYLLNKGCE